MDDRKMEIIKELMGELESMMQPSGDEMGERLGRPKPSLEVVSMEAEGDDMPMDEDMDMEMEEPGDDLKRRLMKLRG